MGKTILHVTTVHDPYDTRIFEKEARSLAAAGCDVFLATTVDRAGTSDGVKLLPLGSLGRHNSRLRRIPRNLRALWYMLQRYDIVHIHDPELLVSAGLCSLFGKRIVFDVHEFYYETILNAHWVPRFLRRSIRALFGLIEHILLPRMAGVVVVSAEMLPHYQRYVQHDRLALVRNFPNITVDQVAQARNTRPPIDGRYIIHTGGAQKVRAFDIIVSAAEHLRSLGCKHPVINIGPIDLSAYSKSEQSVLRRRAEAADVRILGLVHFSESLRWIAHASIGYMPLAVTENNARGMPQKLFEYFCFGLPVVACAFGVVQTILKEQNAGILVDPVDPIAHATALYELLGDQSLFQRLAQASSLAGQAYSFKGELAALLSLYHKILENNGAR